MHDPFFVINRRKFFSSATGICLSVFLFCNKQPGITLLSNENSSTALDKGARTCEIFYRIIERAKKEGWASSPIGKCMEKIGMLMVGTEYVGGTLEGEGPEVCRVDLTGLDCVTLYENVLCISRILKKGKPTFEDFIAELTFTRYRRGKLTDYTSRLHYTSDWIYDNEEKKVVRNITREIGGEEFPVQVSFMSKNPHHYRALKEFPEFIETLALQEQEINKLRHWYIPQKKIKRAQKFIQTGDIIAVATKKEGLDYAHTGLAFRDERGKIRFLHASQKKKKVLLDKELYRYIRSVETYIGITVVRPCTISHLENLQHNNPYECSKVFPF